jgi:hypothetical protein
MRERDHARVGANELPVGSLRKDIAGTAEKQAENEESGSHCLMSWWSLGALEEHRKDSRTGVPML